MLDAADEIADLIYRYDEHVDRGRYADAAAMFAGATVTYEGRGLTLHGASEIESMLQRADRLYDDGTPRTLRFRTNVDVRTDDDEGTAVALSFFTMVQATPEFPLQIILAGATTDELVRRDHGWQFVRRTVDIRLEGDLSAHTLRTTS